MEFLNFNDPFDVTQELRLDFNATELAAAVYEGAAKIVENPEVLYSPSRPLQRRFAKLLDLIRDRPDARPTLAKKLRKLAAGTQKQNDTLEELKKRWREYVPRMRVLCLSELNDSTPMWFHYADAYRGVVLEFEAVDQLDSAFFLAQPVKYQDTPPGVVSKNVWAECILDQSGLDFEKLFDEYQYVKTSSWSYESEWRIQ